MKDTFVVRINRFMAQEDYKLLCADIKRENPNIIIISQECELLYPQELIRCKDCKFSMSGIDKYNERYILCQLHERSYGVIDDGFCKWAERKEE